MSSDLPKRTKADEAAYIAELKREEPIKTEVIVELRAELDLLMQDRITLLEGLIVATDQLRIYRVGMLERSRRLQNEASRTHCGFGCKKHVWHDADGWHRTDEE